MELEAAHPVVLDEPAGLRHTLGAAVRIDAGERDRDIAVLVRKLGDLLVRDLAAGILAGVDGEDDEGHLELAVHVRHFRHGGVLRLVAEVAPHRLLLVVRRIVDFQRGFPGMRMDVDRHQVVKFHRASSRAPAVGRARRAG